jgi:hypothetical protein
MKSVLAFVAGLAAFSGATPSSAFTATQREFRRGYFDCARGRFDPDQHGESYKRGCRAAEAHRGSPDHPPPLDEALASDELAQDRLGQDRLAEDKKACLAAVREQTKNPEAVVLGAQSSQANNDVKLGVGPDQAPWRCLVKDGVVAELMSLSDEGRL